MPLVVALLWPDVLWAQVAWVALAFGSLSLPLLVGWLRFGRLTSYHTWAAKTTAVVMAAGLLALFGLGYDAIFHVAAVLAALEAVEEIAITAVLPGWKADVPTLWHALETRKCHTLETR